MPPYLPRDGERSRNMRLACKPALLWLAFVVGVVSLDSADAPAQTKIRLGKAQAQNFAFLAADVGLAAGIFKRHGIDLEIANFGGDARLVQAMSADAIDIALGGAPTLASEAKGAPMLAIAALADRPGTITRVVAKDGPVKTEDYLKGR